MINENGKLIQLFKKHGLSLIKDQSRCEALIRDYCIGTPQEVNLVLLALKAQIPLQLIEGKENLSLTVKNLVLKLQDKHFIAFDAANKIVEHWVAGLGLTHQYVATCNSRGYENYYLKKYAEANADFTKAIELGTKDAYAYNNRGLVYNELKKYPEAIAEYTKAIDLDPKYRDAYHNRGVVYEIQKKYAEAIADYTKAIHLVPNYVYSYIGRGNAYIGLKKYAEAIANYTKAIELDPKYDAAYNDRAIAYNAIGKTKESEEDFAKAKKIGT